MKKRLAMIRYHDDSTQYGKPWAAELLAEQNCSRWLPKAYMGNTSGGILIADDPTEGAVYMLGRADTASNEAFAAYLRWTGKQFEPCTPDGQSLPADAYDDLMEREKCITLDYALQDGQALFDIFAKAVAHTAEVLEREFPEFDIGFNSERQVDQAGTEADAWIDVWGVRTGPGYDYEAALERLSQVANEAFTSVGGSLYDYEVDFMPGETGEWPDWGFGSPKAENGWTDTNPWRKLMWGGQVRIHSMDNYENADSWTWADDKGNWLIG